MTRLTFLGTGNFLAGERYWNGFVLDGHILVETSPTVLPNLGRCGLNPAQLDTIVISHFHADHTFGWPFLLLALVREHGPEPLHVVGPVGLEERLAQMMEVGSVGSIDQAAHEKLDLRHVEVDGSWQQAGPVRFRAVEVEHVPYLRCFGYVFDLDGRTVGYSGDVRPCPGLDELAAACDSLVLECNGPHPPPATHMDVADVMALRDRFSNPRLILTHLGSEVDVHGIPNCEMAEDFRSYDV